ncbi:MAG: pteridine reductase [Gammaproteobacteria bacterium]|nr:pteridine reductase [Gammaproteobacteria bacterium]MDP2141422.1 pteridine reductase [Gammaproteobacteria bacterium]MDP2346414.1 pteridine reductase [Gammaproteobacteria bacterium]
MSNAANIRPVLLVTGAARRIGAAIVELFHARGYDVLIHCRHSIADATTLRDALNDRCADSALCLQADLCNLQAVEKLAAAALAWRGRIDVLINNASSFYPTAMGQTSAAHWDDLLGSNLKGPFFLSQALSPTLRANHGCIINMTDMHADAGLQGYAAYSIAKAGVKMMTKSLARELAPDVRVNGISPGAILWPEHADNEDTQQRILRSIALGQLGTPANIADTAWFLAATAHYMTGQTIRVDGGRTVDNSL